LTSGASLPGPQYLEIGDAGEERSIAILRREGRSPGLFWLGGFRSDMTGSKAQALDDWAARSGLACVRFDYSGHGRSSGEFVEGTVSRWLEEAEAVFDRFAQGPQIVVGSSMGGWIALLLARRLRERGANARLAGMVLIAPAVDMTKALMSDGFNRAARRALAEQGFYARPSAYSTNRMSSRES
jgi:pimeloyl-ACP methyl ester carboxylesterase